MTQSNVVSFPSLVTRARMSILSHLKTVTDNATQDALRMALLYINTAGDAERCHDREAAIKHLGNAQNYLLTASIAHKMHLTHPLTALSA